MKQYVIVGASAAGISAAQAIRKLDPIGRIVCISDEAEPPYNKCVLADYVSDEKTAEQVFLRDASFFKANKIELIVGRSVGALDRGQRQVRCDDGTVVEYDALFLGLGTRPRRPSWLVRASNLFFFHRFSDAQRVRAFVATHAPGRAVVIGAGLSGLEAADALVSQGVHVAIVDRNEHVLISCVVPDGATFLAQRIQEAGVDWYPSCEVAQFLVDRGTVVGVTLRNGTTLEADMIVCALGASQNVSLAHDAGLAVSSQGIVVDASMRTTDHAIFAGGDCIQIVCMISGLQFASTTWPDAIRQGMCAGQSMTGQSVSYQGSVPVISSHFFGVKLFSCGFMRLDLRNHITCSVSDGTFAAYGTHKQRLRAFTLIGTTSRAVQLKRTLLTQASFYL